MALLATYPVPADQSSEDRVLRAILTLSAGDLSRLRHNVEAARADPRDVLFWAEYPRDSDTASTVRMRDALHTLVWSNFSRASRAPRSWDDLQAVIDLPPDVIARLGRDGIPSRDELVARADEAFRGSGNSPA